MNEWIIHPSIHSCVVSLIFEIKSIVAFDFVCRQLFVFEKFLSSKFVLIIVKCDTSLIVVCVCVISLILIKRLIVEDTIKSIISLKIPSDVSAYVIWFLHRHLWHAYSIYFVTKSKWIWQQNMKPMFVFSFYPSPCVRYIFHFICWFFVCSFLYAMARSFECEADSFLVNLYVAFGFSKMYLCVTLR